MVTKLKTNWSKVKTIYHVADIHVRLYQRQAEYEQVFNNLYEEIKKDTDKAIVFLAGDIVHSKTQLSPELLRMCSNFIRNLSEILPTIIIPGNHDLNLSNESRLDSLTPIIEALNSDNIFYLKDSGIYKFANVNFYHSSVVDKYKFDKSELLDDGANVGCFHGPVQGCRNYLGTEFKSDNFNYGYFSQFDFTLLGDIHLPNQSVGGEDCRFCGSLCQQNHGEAPTEEHGMIKWDVENCVSEFVPIHNDYGYVTFRVEDGEIIEEPKNVPNKARVRIFTKDTLLADTKDIVTDLNKKYNVIALSVIPQNTGSTISELGTVNVRDVSSVDNQEKLLRVWLKSNIDDITEKQITEIIDINKKLNSELPEKETLTGIEWDLKYLSFSNMFSYGEGNYFDFESLKGSVGLFAKNHAGKSALQDCLLFSMFDKCSRASRGVDILNVAKDVFESKLCFSHDGKDYFIERTGKRQKKRTNVKIDVEFYTIDENGNKDDLSGVDRKDTYKNIKKYLGEYDMFVNTLMSLQGNTSGFVYQKQAERKAFLADLLGIAIFENLRSLASNKIKESEILLKEFKKTNFESILADTEVQMEIDRKSALEVRRLLSKVKRNIKELNAEILTNTKLLKEVPKEKLDKRQLLLDKEACKQKAIMNLSSKKRLILDKAMLVKQLKQLNELAEKAKGIPDKYVEFTKTQTEQRNTFRIWERDSFDVKAIQTASDKLLQLEYDEDCTFCMNNIFVKDAITAKDKLETKKSALKILKNTVDSLDKKLLKYGEIEKKNKQYTQLINKVSDLKLAMGKMETSLLQNDLSATNNKNDSLKIDEKITLYEKVKDYIAFNKTVEEMIALKQKELTKQENLQAEREVSLAKLDKAIAVGNERIVNYRKSMEDMQSIETQLIVYRYYLKAVHKNGIPRLLIQDAIPMIEMRINDILKLITDFSVKFDMDDSSIIASIYYDIENFWPIELTSGFEKFVISLAIRIALTQISNLSRSNFMIIDEGWGNFDAENLGNVGKIFEYLENNFKFVLVVSHIDALKDAVNDMVEIEVNDGESLINNAVT